MKEFHIGTQIYFGESALDRIAQLHFDRVIVFADPFVISSGLFDHVGKRLEAAGIRYTVFSEIVPDPPIDKVIAGVSAVLREKFPCIIAIGGGSAIDTAKAVRKFAGQVEAGYSPRLIAIPTTSGTGSEVTSFSVISNPEEGKKYPLCSDDMLPEEAIIDEVLVKSVPASITADTGMDVITHAIEAYVSTNNNEFSGALAEKAIEICGQFLIRSYIDNNDAHARRKMHIAACLAGIAFNSASLGLVHGMAHQLGAHLHIPHGRSCSLLLPALIEYNSGITTSSRSKPEYPSCVRKYCNMARILGVSNFNEITTVRALISYVHFLSQEMHLPARVSESVNISEEEYLSMLDEMAEGALADNCTKTNPRTPTKEEIINIYKSIW